mgnify:CR=1 FL=1
MNKEQFRQQGIEIRKDFPLFNSADVVYLDNAATSQKPECVIQAERDFYEKSNANPLRGLYALAEKATKEYEDARQLQILSVQQIHQKSYLQEMQLKDLILPHTAFHR